MEKENCGFGFGLSLRIWYLFRSCYYEKGKQSEERESDHRKVSKESLVVGVSKDALSI